MIGGRVGESESILRRWCNDSETREESISEISKSRVVSSSRDLPAPRIGRRCSTMLHQRSVTGQSNPSLRMPLFCLAVVVLAAPAAGARESRAVDEPGKGVFDIPAAEAAPALKKYSAQSGKQILYSNKDLAGVVTNEVRGEFTHEEALRRLLAGTPLVATRDPRSGAVAVGRESSDPNGRRAAPKSADVRPTTPIGRSLSRSNAPTSQTQEPIPQP